jgi:hypothetical protein
LSDYLSPLLGEQIMVFVSKRIVSVSLVTLIGALTVGCGESKVSQCNRLIEVANNAVTEVQSVTSAVNPADPESLNQIAQTAQTAADNMTAIEVEDETLQGFQTRFIDMYTATSAASTKIYEALKAQDNATAQTALQELQTATAQEGPLVDEVNAYCSGGS